MGFVEVLVDEHHAVVDDGLLHVMGRLLRELVDVGGVEVVLLRSLVHHGVHALHVRGLHVVVRFLPFLGLLLVEQGAHLSHFGLLL